MKRVMGMVLIVGLAGALRAEEPPDSDVLKQAKEHYRTGTAHYHSGAFDRALFEYETAYQLAPRPAFLFNLAQAHRQLGHKRQALEHYEKYLAVDPKGPGAAESRHYVEVLTQELKASDDLSDLLQTPAAAASTQTLPPGTAARPSPALEARPASDERAAPTATPPPPHMEDSEVAPLGPDAHSRGARPGASAAASRGRSSSQALSRRPLLWGIIGGAIAVIAAGVVTGVALATSSSPTRVDPLPSGGTINLGGN